MDTALHSLKDCTYHRYRIVLETRIGVSGQIVYGDEKGEGSRSGSEFSVTIERTFPAGGEALVFTSLEEGAWMREEGVWRPIRGHEAPSPLYDPAHFADLASSYTAISLQGEEERSGADCRRFLLHLDDGLARKALAEQAWSYFSTLAFELNCTVWVSDPSSSPVALRMEIRGRDPREGLQRYRAVVTLEPYDLDSPGIELSLPGR